MGKKTSVPNNPYIDARREWSDRYGKHVSASRGWFFIALLLAVLCMILGAGLVLQSQKTKIYPYVVEVDKLGKLAAVGPVKPTKMTDERIVKAELRRFLSDLRMVTPDIELQNRAAKHVLARLSKSSPALPAVRRFYKEQNPFVRAETQLVSTHIESILPQSQKTWEVVWVEYTRDRTGAQSGKQRYKGLFTLALKPAANEKELQHNPIGFYVTDLTWTQIQ